MTVVGDKYEETMRELWAAEFHDLRIRQGLETGVDVMPVVEAWLQAMAERRDSIGFPVALYPSGLLHVAAVRFEDEMGEILVDLVDNGGRRLIENDELVQRWVRAPVPIPVEVMRLVFEGEMS